jgi:hypothetical protein
VPLGIRDHALDHAFEDKELEHFLVALARQAVAFAVLAHRQQRLQRLPLRRLHVLQQQVFAQLQAQGVALRVIGNGGHGVSMQGTLD